MEMSFLKLLIGLVELYKMTHCFVASLLCSKKEIIHSRYTIYMYNFVQRQVKSKRGKVK